MKPISLKRKIMQRESTKRRSAAQTGKDDSSSSEDEANVEDSTATLPHGDGGPSKNLRQSLRIIRNSSPEKKLHVTTTNQTQPAQRRKSEQLPLEAAADMHVQKMQAESYVMKLFDRSLDLSKYEEQTPLYPICRAWMSNTPRNLSINSYRDNKSPASTEREDNGLEILTKLHSDEKFEVYAMPAPGKPTGLAVIPTPLPNDELDEAHDDNEENDLSTGNLLAKHKIRWNKVKDNWHAHTKRYRKRYEINELILKKLCSDSE